MNRNEMLKKMGLTEHEFKELMESFRNFYRSLNTHQKAVVTRSLPTLASAAKSFGPDVSANDIQTLFGADASSGVFGSDALGQQSNGDDGDGDGDDDDGNPND